MTKLKILKEPIDSFREGPGRHHACSPDAHPLHDVNRKALLMDIQRRQVMMGDMYGSAAAKSMLIEEKLLGSVKRLPGLPSSYLALSTLYNLDGKFGFEDYLGDKAYDMTTMDIHAELDK